MGASKWRPIQSLTMEIPFSLFLEKLGLPNKDVMLVYNDQPTGFMSAMSVQPSVSVDADLDNVPISKVIEHYGKDELLSALGFRVPVSLIDDMKMQYFLDNFDKITIEQLEV